MRTELETAVFSVIWLEYEADSLPQGGSLLGGRELRAEGERLAGFIRSSVGSERCGDAALFLLWLADEEFGPWMMDLVRRTRFDWREDAEWLAELVLVLRATAAALRGMA